MKRSDVGALLRLKKAVFVVLALFALEVTGGLYTGSLALLSDSGHLLADLLALLLALYAAYLATLATTETKTYGYRRAEELAAMVNAVSLLVICGLILWEAWNRFQNPHSIKAGPLLGFAAVGLLGNVYMAYLLESHRYESLNLKAAWLHVLGDLLGSVGVVASAVVIQIWGLVWFDPACSIFIALLIFFGAVRVLKEAGNILLEGVPKGVELAQVEAAIRSSPGVLDLHDLHVWNISTSLPALSAHVVVETENTHAAQKTLDELNRLLASRFGIHHATFQFECACCAAEGKACSVPTLHENP
ncbi:MAG: cation diffusion facilitator family transporter [candidate division Zixibacteria bacterium]|nr:cation diffusion facilitator family transporter [candidate division Zixibacteria bacterium]